MPSYLHAWEGLLLCAGLSFILWRRLARSQKLPLPPGPPAHFLLGNLKDFPKHREWLAYAKIGQDIHSDIISLSALGKTVVVLNSHRAVADLLDSRAKYADRPQIPMINLSYCDVFSVRASMASTPQSYIHLDMQESVIPKYWPSQEAEARRLVARLFAHGDKTLLRDVQHWAAAFLLSGTFGYHLPADTSNDPLLPYMEELLDMPSSTGLNGFLGDPFQALARRARELKKLAGDDPFDKVKAEMANGVAHSSYVSRMLSNIEQDNEKTNSVADLGNQADYEELIRANAVTLFGVAMQMYPEVQSRARKEVLSTLDPTTGQPITAEIVNLPYLKNVLREVMRWLPALPLGIPHATKEEDEYRGYYIPARSVVVPNLWALSREESIYPDPETFNPDRFNDTSLPHETPFGFGRRRCPGMHLANSNLLIVFAYLLANFKITKAINEDGSTVEPSVTMRKDLNSRPDLLRCGFMPYNRTALEELADKQFT
ncbi:Cytochrome P450 2E1 [Rhizoctonia solani]|uniref:Cytochrome P450 2E1 n=1 Tax=Rhizoctonia solani TaxID=456999 RepID=A0A0K6G3N2_9AGAM|nr:Cytochrome P450 2E1 [Rhizoctonia solani]